VHPLVQAKAKFTRITTPLLAPQLLLDRMVGFVVQMDSSNPSVAATYAAALQKSKGLSCEIIVIHMYFD